MASIHTSRSVALFRAQRNRVRRALTLVLTAAVMVATPFAGSATAQEIDPTFNAEITTSGVIALQPDGKVLVAGSAQDMGLGVVVRFNPDGTLDRTFNFNIGAGNLLIATLNVQADGRILVGGLLVPSAGHALVRLMPDGSLDPTFNFPLFGSATTTAIQPDGKIVVGGLFWEDDDDELVSCVHRVNADGSLDPGFSSNVAGAGVGLALQPSGKIIVAGLLLSIDSGPAVHMARLNANGSLDSSFTPPTMGFGSFVGPFAIRPDGKIVVRLSIADFPNAPRFGVFQLLPDGGMDPAFNTVIDETTSVGRIVIQPDGRALIAGFGRFNQVRTSCLTRLLSDGNVDLTVGIGNNDCRAGDVALQPDGRILAAGSVPRGLSRYLPAIPETTATDLRLVKTASTGAMTNGGFVTYTLKLTNLGTVDAAGITVSDTIPTGLTFNSCSSTHSGQCAGLGNQRTVTFGALASQQTATITITANVTPAAAATLENVASVTSYSPDPVASNNSSSALTYRNPPQLADLVLTKSANRTSVSPGDTLTYTLSVHNDGPNAAASVTVTDTLPAGVTVTSCSASGGSCSGSDSARTITYASIPSGSTRTITIGVTVNADTLTSLVNTATVGSATQDPDAANNVASVTTPSATDEDDDRLPTEWERRFGLRPESSTGSDGRRGDPDNDGVTNEEEFARGTHPRGFVTRFLAEGAANSFFDVRISLLNVSAKPANLLRRYLQPGGAVVSKYERLAPGQRRTLTIDDLTDLSSSDFSTVIESDEPLVVDRTMTWGGGYGSHAETGVPSAATAWYLAEGSTSGDFSLFYLIQNPNPGETTATIRYLLPFGQPPIEKTYTLPGNSRTTIAVDGEGPELALTDVSAVISAPVPIIVERAMYKNSRTQPFAAGHGSAGVTAPSMHWFLAEGATGPFFDCFVLLANPGTASANVTIDYLLSDGRTFTKAYSVPAQGRFTVWVDNEEIPEGTGQQSLDNVAVSSAITSDVPIIVERTMWWPSPAMSPDFWTESHNSPGATQTGIKWALAEGESGGGQSAETYILIANTSAFEGNAQVTLYFEDGTSAVRTFGLQPRSRLSVNTSAEFPEAVGRRFGAVIESLGATPAQIVVERAMYTSPGGATWTAGTNALATRVQ